jgi:hypothetical protein
MKNGKPRSERNQQDFVRRYRLQVIRWGHQAYVDPEREAERLRQALREGDLARVVPRGRGRPPKVAAR